MPIEENKTTVIFDLDGTLINSARGILASLEYAFNDCQLTSTFLPDSNIIGPPLTDILRLLLGRDDATSLDCLSDAFKHHYDSEGYKLTTVYKGIREMLSGLVATKSLFVVTNKREAATRLILRDLELTRFFKQVYTLDMFRSKTIDKSDVLAQFLVDWNLTAKSCIYIGDRPEDAEAASINKINFIGATWGLTTSQRRMMRAYSCTTAPIDILEDIDLQGRRPLINNRSTDRSF